MGNIDNNIQAETIPFNIRVAVALEFGCSLDQIVSISGARIDNIDTEEERWQGVVILAGANDNRVVKYDVDINP